MDGADAELGGHRRKGVQGRRCMIVAAGEISLDFLGSLYAQRIGINRIERHAMVTMLVEEQHRRLSLHHQKILQLKLGSSFAHDAFDLASLNMLMILMHVRMGAPHRVWRVQGSAMKVVA
jgi:hypothetical protein